MIEKVWQYDDDLAEFVCVSVSKLVCDGDGDGCDSTGPEMLENEACPGEPFLQCIQCGAQYSRISAGGQDAHDYREGETA